MKTQTIKSIFLVMGVLFFAATFSSGQDDALNQQFAKRIVRSAGVKAGDVVIIDGGRHMIPLMEAVAIEVQMIGGKPNMMLESDRVSRSFYKDVPDKYLEIEPRYFGEWLKHTDVYIGLPAAEDFKAVMADIPTERRVKAGQAAAFFADIMNSLPVREVDIDFPTKSAADFAGMDFTGYQKLMFAGINADYEAISAREWSCRLC